MSGALGPRRGGGRVGPPLDRLVARRHDLDAAQRALSESRLLTFTGPGGVGKTRLASELAYRASGKFPELLRNKVLFGSDFPVIQVDRWRADFETLDIQPEVVPLIFKTNALRVLGVAG